MVLGIGFARRALGGLGIVAVLFTPTSPRLDPEPAHGAAESVLASTLAPGDHAGILRRAVRIDPQAPSPPSVPPASVVGLGAIAALVLGATRRHLRRRVERPAAPGPVLRRAPTRSPPLLSSAA